MVTALIHLIFIANLPKDYKYDVQLCDVQKHVRLRPSGDLLARSKWSMGDFCNPPFVQSDPSLSIRRFVCSIKSFGSPVVEARNKSTYVAVILGDLGGILSLFMGSQDGKKNIQAGRTSSRYIF